MRTSRFIVPAALALASCTAPSNRAGAGHTSAADSAARIQQVLQGLRPGTEVVGASPVRWTLAERMAKYKVPGVSIAVIDSGRIVWARGFGVKEAGGTDSVTPSTMFQAASISKPITVSAMLRLVQQGKLSLDTNVNRYLTSWKLPENHFTAGHPVTLRLLASHSAGTTVHGFPGYEVGKPLPTLPEVLNGTKPANTAPVRVDTVPGAIFRYSGGGLTIVQQLLIDVTGEPFPVLLQQQVFAPVGMSRSTYQQPLPDSLVANAARAHDRKGVMLPGRWHVYPEMAAAGLWTTPTDLSKWVIAVADAYAGRSAAFLSQATAEQMLTVQKAPLGLGVFLGGEGKGFHFGHGGDNEGFHAQLLMFPGTGQGAAIMTNGDNGPALMAEILYSIGAEYGWPDYGPAKIHVVPVDTATLDQLVGDYAVLPDSQTAGIHIRREGSHLFLDAVPSVPRQELYPESPTTFVAAEGGWRITFTRDGTGRGTGLSFDIIPGMKLESVRIRN